MMEFNPKGVVIGMAMPPDLTVPTYDQLRATVARLEWELAMANDAALKGAVGRAMGTAYEECQKELAATRADLETALNEMGKDDKELEYLNEQLDILRGKVGGWKHDIGRAKAYPDNAERLLTVIEAEMREAVGAPEETHARDAVFDAARRVMQSISASEISDEVKDD